jgi:glycosyltransferase involved in cell wall biosynthesis
MSARSLTRANERGARPLRILHLCAGNRWTGAATPAFNEVEALRASGADAHFAYVGGYKLEAKIGALPYTHPLIERAQNPRSFLRTVRAIRQLVGTLGIEIVHAHLTYDHWLAFVAAGRSEVRVARTFHTRRVLRSDPVSRLLINSTSHSFVINQTFLTARAVQDREATFTPPPVDSRLFHLDGTDVRERYGITADAPVIVAIGKLAPRRGFEEILRAFAILRSRRGRARLLLIGHGPHQPALELLSGQLDLEDSVIWAGYHEDDLAEHYRAADVLLFAARGSDEGHRAILEAMACGTPAATYPLDGVAALIESGRSGLVATNPEPGALAEAADRLLELRVPRPSCAAESERFGFAPAANRLIAGYSRPTHHARRP